MLGATGGQAGHIEQLLPFKKKKKPIAFSFIS